VSAPHKIKDKGVSSIKYQLQPGIRILFSCDRGLEKMLEGKMGPAAQIVEASAALTATWMEASGLKVWTTGHRKCHVLNRIT